MVYGEKVPIARKRSMLGPLLLPFQLHDRIPPKFYIKGISIPGKRKIQEGKKCCPSFIT